MDSVILISPQLKRLLVDELSALVDEVRQIRARPLAETEGAGGGDFLRQRINQAREKLDALKKIQRREKLVRDRRREIDHENEHHHKKPESH